MLEISFFLRFYVFSLQGVEIILQLPAFSLVKKTGILFTPIHHFDQYAAVNLVVVLAQYDVGCSQMHSTST